MSKHQVSGVQTDRLPMAIAEIMDNLDDLIWALALPDLMPIYFNRAAMQIYGDRCQEPKDLWCWLEVVVAADQAKVREAIQKAQVSGSCLVNYRVVIDGCVHYYSARLKVFRDTDGCPMRLDAIATLCKEFDDQLQEETPALAIKQLNQELELRVEQRTIELKLSEERKSAILHSLPDLLLLLKPDGTCVQCITPSLANQNLFVPIKDHISEVLAPETLKSQLKLYAKAIATGESQIYEHKVIKFGKPYYEEVRISPYCDDELLVIVRDITAKKLAEERLVKSDAHLKAAQRISKLGSWEYEPSTGNLIWSEEVYRIYGLDSQLPPPSYDQLQQYIHPEDWQHFDQTVRNAILAGQSYDLEHRIVHADGALLYVLARGEIIFDADGNLTHIIGTVMDATDRKLAELELVRSRDLRESLFNESTDALFLVDSQTLLTTDCNLPAVTLFEAEDKSQLIGIEGHILQRYQFSPEELQEIVIDVNNHGFWNREVEYVTLKGKRFWGNLAVKVIEIASNSINLVRVSDISDRKHFESQILKTSQQLESTNHELESFCYSVSHDLRAPLRHINGFVNALRQQINKQDAIDDPKIIHYLEVIDQSSQKMGQLIDGLLSLSRYGRRSLEFRQLKVRNLVDAAIEIVCGDSDCLANVQFEIGELPDVVGDPTLLEQVFRNLISNAIKFSRNHSQPRVSITSLPDRTVMIKDNGVGFQMEYADKLFGAFQRLHSERDFEGTGIGLAIVQRIVQRHHGKVWAESQPNQGATFFIQI
jgi:PAS domain S-box-containing protein